MSLKLKIRIPPNFKRSVPEPEPEPAPIIDQPTPRRYDDEDDEAGSPMDEDEGSQRSGNESVDEEENGEEGQPPSRSGPQGIMQGHNFWTSNASVAGPSSASVSQPATSSKPLTKQGKSRKSRSKLFGRITPKVPKPPPLDIYGNPILAIPRGPPKPKPLMEVLQRILGKIKKKDDYGIFLEPVDPDAVPTYKDVIKNPMDLSTMTTKLHTGQYRTLDLFSDDFKLMINNCKTFNPPLTLYHTEAAKLETIGNDLIIQNIGLVIEPGPNDPMIFIPEEKAASTIPLAAAPSGAATPSGLGPAFRPGRARPTTTQVKSHARNRSGTVDEIFGSPSTPAGVPSTKAAGTGYHPNHPASQPEPKHWVRGPYKKTAVPRDPVVVGPGGELPGSVNGVGAFPVGSPWGKMALALEVRGPRYRTKKERIEMEKRGTPVLWDGSVDITALDDTFPVLSHFIPERFDIPAMESLTHDPVSTKEPRFSIATTPSQVQSRVSGLLSQQQQHLAPFFTWNPALTISRRPVAQESDIDEPKYAYPERWVRPTDFGVFSTMESPGKSKLAEEVSRQESAPFASMDDPEPLDGLSYARDVGYGGTEGLAWSRSVMDFVGGAIDPDADLGGEEWEDPQGGFGLGMPLQDWVAQKVLDPVTGGAHTTLDSASRHLRAGDAASMSEVKEDDDKDQPIKYSETMNDHAILSLLNNSRLAKPLLRQRIASIIAARRDPIELSSLVKSPNDFQKGDEEWDPEPKVSEQGQLPLAIPVFTAAWADRALGLAAQSIEKLGNPVKSENEDKMQIDGPDHEESEELRKLRFNLLAMAKFIPIQEGVRL